MVCTSQIRGSATSADGRRQLNVVPVVMECHEDGRKLARGLGGAVSPSLVSGISWNATMTAFASPRELDAMVCTALLSDDQVLNATICQCCSRSPPE